MLTVTYQQWLQLSHRRRHHDDLDDDIEAEEEYEDEEDTLNVSFNQCTSHIFIKTITDRNTIEPAYNDIGLYNTSSITSDILWCQSIPHS